MTNKLLFHSLDENVLHKVLMGNTAGFSIADLDQCKFNPFYFQYNKYDDIAVNYFFNNIRNVSVPLSKFLDIREVF